LYNTGSAEQALAYSKLFWPAFVEYDDCVFLSLDLDKYHSWMAQFDNDKTGTESMLNHRHIGDMFEAGESTPHELLIRLGCILKQCWTAKLRADFPQRRFDVHFDDSAAADAIDYEITFCQVR
jgi:hypothetical protein